MHADAAAGAQHRTAQCARLHASVIACTACRPRVHCTCVHPPHCRSLGCLDAQCVLCEHNPHRRCSVNFSPKYLVNDVLKASDAGLFGMLMGALAAAGSSSAASWANPARSPASGVPMGWVCCMPPVAGQVRGSHPSGAD